MAVRRIVANLAVDDPSAAYRFYRDVLGLDPVMDQGWIVTFANHGQSSGQISFASEGGGGTPVPDLSVEVDDLDAMRDRCLGAGFEPVYGPVTEPWGVRRFFVRDPFGRLVNILAHV